VARGTSRREVLAGNPRPAKMIGTRGSYLAFGAGARPRLELRAMQLMVVLSMFSLLATIATA